MLTSNPTKKAKSLSKQIPVLKKVPQEDRLMVFNRAFKSTQYKLLLALVFIGFVIVFYFNLDDILNYKSLERGGLIARSIHFLQVLGLNFFLPLMGVFAILIFGRNFFVAREVKKYLKQ